MARELSDMHRKRRRRNIALALVILGVAFLFYVMSIVRMTIGQAGG